MNKSFLILFWFALFGAAFFVSGRFSLSPQAVIDETKGPAGTGAKKVAHYDEIVQQRVDNLLGRIKTEAAGINPFVLSSLCDVGAKDAELKRLEFQLGFAIPGELRAFLKMQNGKRMRISGDFLGSDLVFLNAGEILAQTSSAYSWISRKADDSLIPGFVVFMMNGDAYLGVNVEDGSVWLIPKSDTKPPRFHSESLGKWLSNIAERMEGGRYALHDGGSEFQIRDQWGVELESPGIDD